MESIRGLGELILKRAEGSSVFEERFIDWVWRTFSSRRVPYQTGVGGSIYQTQRVVPRG